MLEKRTRLSDKRHNTRRIELTDDKRNDERPHRELCRPNFDRDDSEDKHGKEDAEVPPLRNLAVPRHQPSMDVWLLVHCLPRLRPNLFAEVEERMRKRSSDARKRQAI